MGSTLLFIEASSSLEVFKQLFWLSSNPPQHTQIQEPSGAWLYINRIFPHVLSCWVDFLTQPVRRKQGKENEIVEKLYCRKAIQFGLQATHPESKYGHSHLNMTIQVKSTPHCTKNIIWGVRSWLSFLKIKSSYSFSLTYLSEPKIPRKKLRNI